MTRPTTLAAALVQVEQLTSRLSLASQLFHHHTGKDLQPLLDAQLLSPASPLAAHCTSSFPPPTSPPRATSPSPSDAPPEVAKEPELVDIGPLVLKALAIRKGVHVGEIEDGEKAIGDLVEGLPLTSDQRAQLRTWAGLD